MASPLGQMPVPNLCRGGRGGKLKHGKAFRDSDLLRHEIVRVQGPARRSRCKRDRLAGQAVGLRLQSQRELGAGCSCSCRSCLLATMLHQQGGVAGLTSRWSSELDGSMHSFVKEKSEANRDHHLRPQQHPRAHPPSSADSGCLAQTARLVSLPLTEPALTRFPLAERSSHNDPGRLTRARQLGSERRCSQASKKAVAPLFDSPHRLSWHVFAPPGSRLVSPPSRPKLPISSPHFPGAHLWRTRHLIPSTSV